MDGRYKKQLELKEPQSRRIEARRVALLKHSLQRDAGETRT